MSLNNIKNFIVFLFVLFTITSCNKQKKISENELSSKIKSEDFLLAQSKQLLGDNVLFASNGNFDNKSEFEIIAGKEIVDSTKNATKFYFIKFSDGIFMVVDSTKILKGTLKNSLVDKIKFPFFNFESILFQSKNYLLENNNKVSYTYIINFSKNIIYYSRLIFTDQNNSNISISKNVKMNGIKNFLIALTKKDFPNAKIINY